MAFRACLPGQRHQLEDAAVRRGGGNVSLSQSLANGVELGGVLLGEICGVLLGEIWRPDQPVSSSISSIGTSAAYRPWRISLIVLQVQRVSMSYVLIPP
jgi:hypothetical protein